VNATVLGLMVDALWREQRLVVELDGHAAHANAAAAERDRGRELLLRGAGFRVIRYTWAQVTGAPEAVIADLRAALARR
jgi:very-short-patch-repair endonuclease